MLMSKCVLFTCRKAEVTKRHHWRPSRIGAIQKLLSSKKARFDRPIRLTRTLAAIRLIVTGYSIIGGAAFFLCRPAKSRPDVS